MRVSGTVVAFDDERGLGEVEARDGRRYPFHCTAIADGTRSIPTGVSVDFDIVAGPVGRYEAAELRRTD